MNEGMLFLSQFWLLAMRYRTAFATSFNAVSY
jgi:hypothetical protein